MLISGRTARAGKNGVIKRVWVRYRNKLKGVPLEFVRLAALEEVEGSKVCQDALQEVERELQGERPEVEEMLDPAVEDPGNLMEFSGDEEDEVLEDLPPEDPPRASALDDVPIQLHRDKRGRPPLAPQPPEETSGAKKVRFDEAMNKAARHLSRMRAVLEKRTPETAEHPGGASASSSNAPPPPRPASHRGHGAFHVCHVWHWGEAMRAQREMVQHARGQWEVCATDLDKVTSELMAQPPKELPPPDARVEQGADADPLPSTADPEAPVTGKPRLEFKWHKLDGRWKQAFIAPLKKAVDVYIDNQAIEAVELGRMIPPEKILPSRFVLTNKNDEETIEKANLRARWVLAGHLDKEAGQWATEAPTASLISHNIVCFLSAQYKWPMKFADISAAFLQGENLCAERVVFAKMPKGYPEEIVEHLLQRLAGPQNKRMRRDLVRLTKGGFGLAESPRLWYRRLKRVLVELGLQELKLAPGTFVYFAGGELKGILTIHVDDLRMAFDPAHEAVLAKLREKFRFGEWRSALEEVIKFCGRWEKQCPQTFKVTISMDGYAHKLQDPPLRAAGDRSPLRDSEKKWVSSVGGQLNWMARQGRADLAFGISKLQQMAGSKDPETMKYLKGLVTRAREHYESYFQAIEGELKDMVFLAVSDASHGSMPKGHSQGGMMVLVGNDAILERETVVNCLMYHSAVIKRVVRSSLAAEVSQAAEALDQCEFVRAMMGEILDHQFSLPAWQWSANQWKEILVLDSKTGYDVLNSINNGEDRRLAIDIAILKEALYEPETNRWVRWVPGMTMPADGLTKDPGNPMRDQVLRGGPWSLCDSPAAQRLRQEAGHRKRQCKDRRRARESEFEANRQSLKES